MDAEWDKIAILLKKQAEKRAEQLKNKIKKE